MSKQVLIAESSKLVIKFLTDVLEKADYKVIVSNDGFDTILQTQKYEPDCVLCSNVLPVLNGFEISKIIKKQPKLTRPVLIYTISDELLPDTVINTSLCDEFLNVDTDFPEEIVKAVNAAIGRHSVKKSKKKNSKKEDYTVDTIQQVTGYYQKQNEYLNIINSICVVNEISTLPHEAAIGFIDILLNFVPYDIAFASICQGDKVYDFCRVKNVFSQEEINDFIMVSHDRFLSNCPSNRQMKFLDCMYEVDGSMPFTRSNSMEKIRSIENSILFSETFAGTITIGSTKADFYTEALSQKFQYFSEKLSPFATALLEKHKMRNDMRNLRKAFSSFVPEEIIEDLIEKANVQTETAGEKRRVAVLVCDIRSFTNISEKNKPENVVSFLNEYFTQMVDIIKSHGGSIDKFMGDAIMALFGAPISYEDNARRAVRAAVDMINNLPKIDSSKLILPDGYKEISIGIGIHYGEVILGSIGCADKKDYTVIGDSVNLASRMEGLTKLYGKHILISESVREELGTSIQTHKVDKVAVKGKKIPVWVYSVENEADIQSTEYYNNYDKAMELYEVGAWTLAEKYFANALQVSPENTTAKLMLERCQNYIINPPENWDGAVVMTSK